MASGDQDADPLDNMSMSDAASSAQQGKSVKGNGAPGTQMAQPVLPRRIEIGLVEGDAIIIGGAAQVFLKLPGKASVEEIVEGSYNVVRLARLPSRSELHVPYAVQVNIREIAGDLQGGQLKGLLQVKRVAGNVALDGTGEIDINSIGGNGGVYHAAGRVSLGKVAGNLMLVDAPYGVFAEVGGDAVLDTSLNPHAEFVTRGAANVTLRTHGAIHARFVAQTARGEIRTQLPLMVERGRRRNLVGVMGRGDATVTLRSKYGDITIIAADSDEKEYSMSNEFASDSKEQGQGNARTWEGGFGRHRFRAQWDRGPKHTRFHFQGPFTGDDDPDGVGTAFAPDFGFEWEQGRGAHAYGEYEERWDDIREKAERTAHRAAERAKRYAERATRHMRDTNWDVVEREVLAAVEKALADMEEAFANIRRDWNKRQAGTESSKSGQGSRAQRVPIEYDRADDTSASSTEDAFSTPLSRDDRDAQRRVILEELRTGAISLEEAERRLNALG